MYKRMLEYAEENKDKNKSVSDVTWQLGEGGDQKTKQAAIVMSNIQNFPELYNEFDKVIGSGGSSSKGRHIPLNDEGGTENTNEKYSWIHGF